MTQSIAIELIDLVPDLCPRVDVDSETVDRYRDVLEGCGDVWPFPDLIVYRLCDGERLSLADGAHRLRAASAAKWSHVPCDVRQGSKIDLFRDACRANQKHGLPFDSASRRQAVIVALRLLGPEVTGAKLSELTGYTPQHCNRVKREVQDQPSLQQRVTDNVSPPQRPTRVVPSTVAAKDETVDTLPTDDVHENRGASTAARVRKQASQTWSFESCQAWHQQVHRELTAMLRNLTEICKQPIGEYLAHGETRILADLKAANCTLYQLTPMEERDGRIITRNERQSRA